MSEKPAESPAGNVSPVVYDLVRSVGVTDALFGVARRYRAMLDVPEDVKKYGINAITYLAERATAQAELLRKPDGSDALEGYANAVDLLRGWRALAAGHPNEQAREIYAAFGNSLALFLSERAGIGVEVAPDLDDAENARGTLGIWHETVVRASQGLRKPNAGSAIHLVGRASEVRAAIVRDFLSQGMAEIGVLIDLLGSFDPARVRA